MLAAAGQLGYTPNIAGRALRTGKVDTFALVQPARVFHGEFFTEIIAGIQYALRERKLDLLVSMVPPEYKPEMWMRRLATAGRCDAMAVLLESIDEETLHAIRQLNLPIALINYIPEYEETGNLNWVGFDQVSGVQQSVRHLKELGHKDLAFLCCPKAWQDLDQREKGFRIACKESGIQVREDWIIPCPIADGPRGGAAAIDLLLSSGQRKPTAVVCASDDVALGALNALRRWGKTVPQDMSVVGFDDDMWTAHYSPALTTVSHRGWDLGLTAGRLLVNRYDQAGLPHETVVIPTRLVVRESTAPPKQG